MKLIHLLMLTCFMGFCLNWPVCAQDNQATAEEKKPALTIEQQIDTLSLVLSRDPLNPYAPPTLYDLREQQIAIHNQALDALIDALQACLDDNPLAAMESFDKVILSRQAIALTRNYLAFPIEDMIRICQNSARKTLCEACGGTQQQDCETCEGLGWHRCPTCSGTGEIRKMDRTERKVVSYDCPTCLTRGIVICTTCQGKGTTTCETCKKQNHILDFSTDPTLAAEVKNLIAVIRYTKTVQAVIPSTVPYSF